MGHYSDRNTLSNTMYVHSRSNDLMSERLQMVITTRREAKVQTVSHCVNVQDLKLQLGRIRLLRTLFVQFDTRVRVNRRE